MDFLEKYFQYPSSCSYTRGLLKTTLYLDRWLGSPKNWKLLWWRGRSLLREACGSSGCSFFFYGSVSSAALLAWCAPNVSDILWNSLSQRSDLMKLPLTVMTPRGPGIFSLR